MLCPGNVLPSCIANPLPIQQSGTLKRADQQYAKASRGTTRIHGPTWKTEKSVSALGLASVCWHSRVPWNFIAMNRVAHRLRARAITG